MSWLKKFLHCIPLAFAKIEVFCGNRNKSLCHVFYDFGLVSAFMLTLFFPSMLQCIFHFQHHYLRNIAAFLQACRSKFSIMDSDLFSDSDLYDVDNFQKVT